MLFNSIQFIIFFPIVILFYFSLPHRFRNFMLVIASYYFYMCWKAEYLILILISTTIDYYCGINMEKIPVKSKRKKYLLFSLIANLGLLFSFKYFNFFNDSVRSVFDHFNIFYGIPEFKVLLPVGISFYTFQTLSYTIDVYRGKTKAEHNLIRFALYVAFFPQLVAGPIERSTRLLPQFYKKFNFDYKRVSNGLKLMLWGFFKKVVIADTLAWVVNQVYNNPNEFSSGFLLLATYFFAFQIFCDFSGYSDIAIGTAQVMGFDLMLNFNRPYHSRSISEFWKRWHISLSSWFKDYLYISLGGNRVVKWRWYSNLMIVFLLSGLWHGANWTFVCWGALHGIYLILSIWTVDIRKHIVEFFRLNKFPKIHSIIQVFITFHLVLISWIFFRANSLSDAFLIIRKIFSFDFTKLQTIIPLTASQAVTIMFFILVMEIVHLFQIRGSIRDYISEKPVIIRWFVYYAVLIVIFVFGQFTSQEFIYFQF